MNEFNCMTEANYQHRQAVKAAHRRKHTRKVARAFRREVTLVAIDAALAGATAVALIVMVVCAVMGG